MSQPASEQALPTDADLIRASRSGDTAAYGSLYERHVGAARGLAGQLVRGPAEVDDVVAEAFARVLDLLRRGGGPNDAFRPYLLTAVRRVAYDRYRAESRQVVSGEMEAFDPGQPFIDPAVAGLERTMIARAFLSLPERWRAVLWHTEIEGAKPAEVAAMLGLSANGVAALAYRAREGLRQAYLQMHLSTVRQECRPIADKLGAYVRGGLSKRDATAVAAHLEDCADCRATRAELADVNVALRGVVAPIFLGPAAAAYLSAMAAKGGVVGTVGGWLGGRAAWFRHAPKQQQAAAAGGAAAAVAGLVAVALALTASSAPVKPRPRPVAAPSSPPPAPPHQPPPHSAVPPHSAPPRHRPAPPVKPRPVPPSSPRPVGSPRPSSPRPPSPRPSSPRPAPPPPPAPQLAAKINPVGSLLRGGTGIVEFAVTNTGDRIAKSVTAAITLPRGVTYLAGGTLGADGMSASEAPGGWSCRPDPAGAQCTHGPLDPGASATTYLHVVIATDAPLGTPPTVSADVDGRRVEARGESGVIEAGLPARYAAEGHNAVLSTGNVFPHCGWWDGVIPGWCKHRSSSATLSLPGPVEWAGLYWSWVGSRPSTGVELAGPGSRFQHVGADHIGTDASLGEPVHEAFADVTDLVRRDGSGTWSAKVPNGESGWEPPDGDSAWQPPNGDSGWGRYGGWALVVVAADPSVPVGQVMVLDGAHVVTPGGSYSVPVDGLVAGHQAADVSTIVSAAVATAVALTGMWRFFGIVLHFSGPDRVATFAFIELAMVTEAFRARRNIRESAARAEQARQRGDQPEPVTAGWTAPRCRC